jgi:hypothetical protein
MSAMKAQDERFTGPSSHAEFKFVYHVSSSQTKPSNSNKPQQKDHFTKKKRIGQHKHISNVDMHTAIVDYEDKHGRML